MLDWLPKLDLPALTIKGRRLLPIVQGGMGVGISAHRLAGSVAQCDAVGTIASVDLRHHHPDLLARSKGCRDPQALNMLNLEALDREVKMALSDSNGHGMVAVNVMKAVDAHADYVRQACESGAHAVVMGAGLPLDLPELTADHPDVARIPILSDVRGVAVVLKKWLRKQVLPDAVVIEHPQWAGGHLGAARKEDVNDSRFNFDTVLEGVANLLRELGIERERIPFICAGGIYRHQQVRDLLGKGAAGVQLGTAFAVTSESDAHPNFKKVLAGAKQEEIVEFMSVAGLPARGVLTPWLKNYLRRETHLQSKAKCDTERCTQGLHCLTACGLRDGLAKFGQFCIDTQLAAALRGEVNKGLFFRGGAPLPFGDRIRSARELIEYLLTGHEPAPTPSQ
ncbi:nitronate monooxygenase [Chitinivorax tropicus]|uniref:Nitronate monooxygenase n=1 Tax=Chitinivorax tropicus TaxID=714531 RepID=A0A840MMQ8_9PROT|nr:nitronate monooxygenase family protein [Chitinivorax tropicus]MBB5020434.1 nitronate monooxygenase [Chitinivorax tropicus]